ncbi:phage terminase small subunit [Actinobacillus lignieresii]|uniref:Phage small terminase subunit n=1 Tax=Actinobacillus lignieresii TaxID=720 RepID=A0A380TSX5_ACTLI|nr:phage terminase small subunit [Actinobacillus lignieresii]SUT91584.1 Phage small terminase subunit [Actinobacillus lignieresii]
MTRMSPARAHFLNTLAQKESAQNTNIKSLDGLTGYELLKVQLNAHQRQLKQLQSVERKIEFKQKIFAEYKPWIDGVLNAGTGVQDEVLMTWLVWSADAGNFDYFFQIAEYALFHELALPERYERTLGTTIAEEVADAAKRARDLGHIFDLAILTKINELTESEDMPDQVRAKLIREIAEREIENDTTLAISLFKRAFALDENIGVKTIISKLEKQLEKSQAESLNE